jgi:polar amino acid transport system substrate-binding protein
MDARLRASAHRGENMTRRRKALTIALALLGFVPVATAASAGTTPRRDARVAAEAPAKIRAKGTLTVAADATYAPNEFIADDGHTVVGMDPDIAHALGRVLGLNVHVTNASFDTIIPGLASGKYDLGMSSFTDTKAREKVVRFVDYFSAGTSFYVDAHGGPSVQSLASLCGQTVAVERGTTQAADATAQSHRCTAAGKRPVSVHVFPDQNAANLAVASGRAQVGMADSPVAAYIVKKSHGKLALTGKAYDTAPYGIAVPKGSGMTTPIRDALTVLMGDGSYKSILAKWGVQSSAIAHARVDGAIS